MGFRNQSTSGGSTGISMSVGPSQATGVQTAFPVDVVSYGGVSVEQIQINGGAAEEILTAPAAGTLYCLRRLVCLPGAGLTLVLFDPASGAPWGATTSSNPADNLSGQLVATALSVQIVGNSTPVPMSLSYDVVLIPTIT
jgi:hypothetical protein